MSERSQVRRWYSNRRWARRARLQLKLEPLCRMCLADGVVAPAEVADHVVPHKGDAALFWRGELQSLCKAHHDSSKAQIEAKGFVDDIGADGWPVDRSHPVNQLKQG